MTRAWAGAVLWAGVVFAVGCGPGVTEAPEVPRSTLRQEAGSGGHTRWVRRSVNTPEYDIFTSDVTTDRDGANIVVGSYEGAPDFGNGPLPAVTAEFGYNAFIVKYARNGRLLWAHGFGAAEGVLFPDTYFEVAVTDRARNITVRGNTSHPVTLGGVTVTGFFLVQFSRDGEVRWVRSLGGNYDGSPGLTVDREDHVILAGAVDGPADFGGGPRATGPISAFIVKYTRDGAWVWDRVFVSQDTGYFGGVATDEDDHIYVSGSFNEETDFGGGALRPSEPGTETAVVARYTPNGAHVWSRTLEDVEDLSRFDDVAVHGNRVVVVGRFTGRFDFDGRTFTARELGGTGLVLAVTRAGEDRWGHALGGWVRSVRADLEDDMTVLGVAMPGDDVGSGPLPPSASFHTFVSKLDRVDGEREWVRTFSTGTTTFAGLSVARHGEVAVAGSFHAPVDFGTGMLLPSTPGFYEMFLLRMAP